MEKSTTMVQEPPYNKLENVIVSVTYRKPGNVVSHFSLEFEVFQNCNSFKAVPLSDKITKRLVSLPDVVHFSIQNGVVLSESKHKDLAVDIAKELAKKNIIEMKIIHL